MECSGLEKQGTASQRLSPAREWATREGVHVDAADGVGTGRDRPEKRRTASQRLSPARVSVLPVKGCSRTRLTEWERDGMEWRGVA